jgi:hypothetical protein
VQESKARTQDMRNNLTLVNEHIEFLLEEGSGLPNILV